MALLGFSGYAPVLPAKLGSSLDYDWTYFQPFVIAFSNTLGFKSFGIQRISNGSVETSVKGWHMVDMIYKSGKYEVYVNTQLGESTLLIRSSPNNVTFATEETVATIPTVTTRSFDFVGDVLLPKDNYYHFRGHGVSPTGTVAIKGYNEVHIQ